MNVHPVAPPLDSLAELETELRAAASILLARPLLGELQTVRWLLTLAGEVRKLHDRLSQATAHNPHSAH